MSLIDEILELDESRGKTRPPRTLYATDLTKPCLKSAYMNIVDPKPYSLKSLRVFQAGNLLESYWAQVLERHPDYRVLDTQVPAYHYFDGWEIHGRADILTQHRNSRLVLHEVKTTKSAYYQRGNGPSEQHLDQLHFYLNCLGVRHGRVDYLDKSHLLGGEGPVDLSFEVIADGARFSATLAKARVLRRALEAATPPPAEKCWLCGYCLHADLCAEASS